jgi:hypothetical protein
MIGLSTVGSHRPVLLAQRRDERGPQGVCFLCSAHSISILRYDYPSVYQVINHLQAENNYCATHMARLQPLQNKLYDEMLSHLKETDQEVYTANCK